MVLRIHIVRDGGHAYYVNDLVPGRAEGTLVAGEEPGHWWGGGATALGRHDQVEAHSFAEVLAGRDPATGESLRIRRSVHGVDGYDLTFGAPKSVSLLHLLAPREIADQTGEAHRAAVAEALGYLERTALGVRRSTGDGLARLPATGMVAGVFLHRTSRALDPHLHTHAVVANVAEGVDGRWSAVDSRRVFGHVRAAQAVYHARLRLEVGERLGAAFEVGPSGLGDVVGIDPSLRRLFSQRTAAMDEYRHRRPEPRRRSSKGAFHATRPDKDRTRTVDSLRAEWRGRAAVFGLDLTGMTAVVGRRQEIGDDRTLVDPQRMRAALEGLAPSRRSLARRDLVAAAGAASVGGASATALEHVADRLIQVAGHAVSATVGGHPGVGRGAAGPEPRWPCEDVVRVVSGPRWREVATTIPGRRADLADLADRSVRRDRGVARQRDGGPPVPEHAVHDLVR